MNAPRVFYRENGRRRGWGVGGRAEKKAMTERRDFVLFAFLERRSAGQHFPSCGGENPLPPPPHPSLLSLSFFSLVSLSTVRNAKIENERETVDIFIIYSTTTTDRRRDCINSQWPRLWRPRTNF
jgi:hypothetical protein